MATFKKINLWRNREPSRYSLTFILQHLIRKPFDYTMHFLLTKFFSVNSPPYYSSCNYDACNTTFLGPICHIIEVINMHQ